MSEERKEKKDIRFRAVILDDVEKYANIHRMKDADGKFDFTQALHERYIELLDKEQECDRLRVDVEELKLKSVGLRQRTETQPPTQTSPMPQPPRLPKKIVCEYHQGLIRVEVSQEYCDQCMSKQIHPTCPRILRERK